MAYFDIDGHKVPCSRHARVALRRQYRKLRHAGFSPVGARERVERFIRTNFTA